MLRFRWPIVVLWLVVVLVGGWASGRLAALQSNVFSVPGTDSEHVRQVLQEHFGDRSDGAFTVVFRVPDSSAPACLRGSRATSTGPPTRFRPGREPSSRSPGRRSSTAR